ncbi:MAG TPA: metallophosphoesterase [Chloroflexia bacterium]|nr:metallophosphoesterase [Chloroflexia bacterium]
MRRVAKACGLGFLWIGTLAGALSALTGLAYFLGNLPALFKSDASAAVWWAIGLRTVIALLFAVLAYWLLFHPLRSLHRVQGLLYRLSGERWFRQKFKVAALIVEELENELNQVEREVAEVEEQPPLPLSIQASPVVFPPISRRRFLAESAVIGAFSLNAFYLEPRNIELIEREVRLPELPPAFDGLKIAQISDIHVDPFTPAEDIAGMVQQVNALKPDLTFVTGDFISRGTYYFEEAARTLGALRDGTRLGLYGVSGNHDHWSDGDDLGRLEPDLKKYGLPLLRNTATRIELRGDSLWLMGTDDSSTHNENLDRTLRAAGFSDATAATRYEGTKILLTHNPSFTREAVKAAPDLILSGHTHGGQVYIPLIEDVVVSPIFPYYRGYYKIGDRTQLFVNRGAGVVGPPMRFMARPEILLLTLRRT